MLGRTYRSADPMKPSISPFLKPISCLDIEPPEARALTWLPLAVRYKLDECGLRISLREWQELPLQRRAALVAAPLAAGPEGFQQQALAAGAGADQRPRHTETESMLIGDLPPAATLFTRYVLGKLCQQQAA